MSLKEILTSELKRTIREYHRTETLFMPDDLLALAKTAQILDSLDVEVSGQKKLNYWLKSADRFYSK